MINASRRAIEKLARQLELPLPDPFSQDWEYEVADSTKVALFLKYYGSGGLDIDEKRLLMNIIITSYNDSIGEGSARPEDWELISRYLVEDRATHEDTLNYWALPDEVELENCFPVTPLVRDLMS